MWAHALDLTLALAPVFLLLALGRGLGALRLIPTAGADALGQLLYWVALPALLVTEVARTDLRATASPAGIAAGVLSFTLALIVGWWATGRLTPAERGAALDGMARANGAFVGLPVIALAATTLPEGLRGALTAAYATTLTVMVVVFNVGSVVAYRLPHHGVTWVGLRAALAELPRNPLILACLTGGVLAWIQPGLLSGHALGRTLELLGAMAVPLALLTTGARIDLHLARARPVAVGLITAAKLVLVPLGTWVLCRAFGAPEPATVAVVVMMACPTAIAAGPMAGLLGGDERLVAAVVVTTTALAPLTLLVWLTLLTG
jgi:predicted permease